MKHSNFTEEPMQGTLEHKLKTFDDLRISHPKVEKVYQEITRYLPLYRKRSEHMTHIILHGPTGTGKTEVGWNLLDRYSKPVETIRTSIPAIRFKSPIPFTWKGFTIRALESLNAPAPQEACAIRNDNGTYRLDRNTEFALATRLVTMIRNAKTRMIIVDEFGHMNYARQSTVANIEHLKASADDFQVMMILIGLPECRRLINLNSQTIRRFRPVALERYKLPNKKGQPHDGEAFARLIVTLEKALPLPTRSHLHRHWALLHKYTLGLIGPLKNLFACCLKDALENDKDNIDLAAIEEFRMPDDQLKDLKQQIEAEEAQVAPDIVFPARAR